MGHKVIFSKKDGSETSAIFPTLAIAQSYLKTVSNGKIETGGCDDNFAITKCPSSKEAQERRKQEKILKQKEAKVFNLDKLYEAEPEHTEEIDEIEIVPELQEEKKEIEHICHCGKPCQKGLTLCYTCRRYR